eukprot:5500800-Pyramimonas_sp.AAC.1
MSTSAEQKRFAKTVGESFQARSAVAGGAWARRGRSTVFAVWPNTNKSHTARPDIPSSSTGKLKRLEP